MPARHTITRAFTLVEILIVVVILGILAAIVVPQFTGAAEESRRSAFVTELKVFMDGAELYRAREGQHVSDGSSGECPDEFAGYVDAVDFEAGTPIGGVWDTEYNDNGVTAAVGVHFMDPDELRDDAYMLVIDALFDDGDLSTGLFQKLAEGRFYAIVEE
ncbi:MAG: prepilin-type N-terminal cleavage/methylation domain-containing protein [Phycisphaerales bacterium]|nr:prepilin-type N-terminal cleavage/methylation domain-containing protein [Phycisphaerales bacterium]